MSRNGSGTYNLPAGNPVVSGTTITTTWANTTLNDIASSLTGSVAADGQTPMTGALNMGSNKVISVTDPTNAQDAATKNYTDTAITTATSGLSATYLTKANNLSDVSNATTARGNLTAAKSGANSDITSLTGLTTPLTVAQGGIGAATLTANNVLLGNGTSAPQVVAPSTSGNILTSNGTTWVSSAPSVGPTFSAYMANGGNNLSLSAGTYTKIKIDTKNWDTNSNFNTSNYRFTPTVAGYYQINGGTFINYGSTAPNNSAILIYKNGTAYRQNYLLSNAGNLYGVLTVGSLIYFNGSTDYVELYAFQNSSGDAFVSPYASNNSGTWFDGCLVRSA